MVHRESSAHAATWLRAGPNAELEVCYCAVHAGPHDVWVLLNGNPLPGCPYHVNVRPAAVCPNAATIDGLTRLSAPPVTMDPSELHADCVPHQVTMDHSEHH